MTEGVDVKNLLQAVMRRGGYKPPASPTAGDFESIRQLSIWTGCVYAHQQLALKRNAMLILQQKAVTIMLDTDKRTVNFQSAPRNPGPDVLLRLQELVFQVLGQGWHVTCGTISDDAARSPRKPAQRRRKQGSRKARKRA